MSIAILVLIPARRVALSASATSSLTMRTNRLIARGLRLRVRLTELVARGLRLRVRLTELVARGLRRK